MQKNTAFIVLLLLAALCIAVGVSAQDAVQTPETPVAAEMPSTPQGNGAHFRIAHFSADAPSIDVYINGNLAVKNLNFPSVSQWITIQPGTYTVTIAPSGQSASAVLIEPIDVGMSGDTWQTVAIVGSANSGTLNGALVVEAYTDLLPSTGGFTFLHALDGGPPVNFVRNDVVYFAYLTFPGADPSPASSSVREDSGIFHIRVTDANDPNNILAENTSLEIPENSYTLVALIGTLDNPRLFTLVTDRSVVEVERARLPAPGTLMDALRGNSNLTTLADTLAAAGLVDLLSSSTEYTVFAPANFALDGSDTISAEQASVVNSYIVEGKFTKGEFMDAGTLTALDGTPLTITTNAGGIYINGVLVIDVNIAATNGVIHMVRARWDNAASQ